MPVACVDWREADSGVITALYGKEVRRWSAELGWDTAGSWEHIEMGRRLGTVPGLLALDRHGVMAGWTFFIAHRGVLQIGGFVAGSTQATTVLLDGIFASDAAARAKSITFFVFAEEPWLSIALERRGLTVGAYHYLVKPLPGELPQGRSASPGGTGLPAAFPLRAWGGEDAAAIARLLKAAYPVADSVRPFAPRGTIEEWKEYLGQLVDRSGCGTFMPGCSFVVPASRDEASGLALVTRVAPKTAHIAQLAVEPAAQRRGLGRNLVDAACARASQAGCDRITLLVESRNTAARRLYDAAGFQPRASFVSAGGVQPLPLANVPVRRGADNRA